MLLWATKAQFSTGPNWASLSLFFLFVYFCLTAAAAFPQLLFLCWRRAGVGMGFTGFVFSITVKAEKTRMRSALPPFQIESPIRFELREFPLFLLDSVRLTWLATGQKNSSRVSAAAPGKMKVDTEKCLLSFLCCRIEERKGRNDEQERRTASEME